MQMGVEEVGREMSAKEKLELVFDYALAVGFLVAAALVPVGALLRLLLG